jgi:hypothetical protein
VDLTQADYCSSQPVLESVFTRSILNKNGSVKADVDWGDWWGERRKG